MSRGKLITISLLFISSFCLYAQNIEYSFNVREGNIFYHTVEPGQNVYRIGIMYNVADEEIYQLNPSSREYIKIGETLKIPQKEISNSTKEDDMYYFHTIQPLETIYGVSKKYNITGEQLANANPGLTQQTFSYGKNIRIPFAQTQTVPVIEKRMVTKEIEYTVKRSETMFSITRTFKVTNEQLIRLNPSLKSGLKAGMVIKIPVETEETVVVTPNRNELDLSALIADRNRYIKVDHIKIAVLLPFSVFRLSQSRTEFYEGLLMAVMEMQNSGVSIELSTYDIGEGTRNTRDILQNEPLRDYNLLIGGETNDQIELISDYARKNGIKYVVPFSSTCDILTSSNASIFQVNTSSQHLHAYATAWACSLFSNHNIIFVNTNDRRDDKMQFVRDFKADLTQRTLPFRDLNYNPDSFSADLSDYLSPNRPNLIVPLSSSLEALNKIRGTLRLLADAPRQAPQITLFGYPEWQQYTNECLEDFYALNTYIYTSFYANNLSPDIQQFHAGYRFWFNKNMIQSSQRYALLGYDTGRFFISAIHTFGSNFENNIRQVNEKSLQKGFRFERVSNWSGFFNTNLYMVHYKRDYTITRYER